MMGKTHITIGVTSALLIAQHSPVEEFHVAILGGAIGGIICDIEVESNSYFMDARVGRIIVGFIALITLSCDFFFSLGMIEYILSHMGFLQNTGIFIFTATYILGTASNHRTFTHSILALLILCLAFHCIYPRIVPYFAAGFISHIMLDLLNKKKVQVFYPLRKGFCLKLCYADKEANTIFMYIGLIISPVLLASRFL